MCVTWDLSHGMLFVLVTFISSSEWCKVGVAICYDLRFKDLASIYAQQGEHMGALVCGCMLCACVCGCVSALKYSQ